MNKSGAMVRIPLTDRGEFDKVVAEVTDESGRITVIPAMCDLPQYMRPEELKAWGTEVVTALGWLPPEEWFDMHDWIEASLNRPPLGFDKIEVETPAGVLPPLSYTHNTYNIIVTDVDS